MAGVDGTFDLCGTLRRIRRLADLSQRELATAVGVSRAAIGHAEAGRRDLPASVLARAAGLAGLRLALLDLQGREVAGMADGSVRDMVGRRFPAHLDTRHSDDDWWHGEERRSRPQPWYTFDRERSYRDGERQRHGTPDDHQLPQPGDSPRDRALSRRAEARRRQGEERRQRLATGQREWPDDFRCDCPPACAELDRGERPVHVPECPCGCDVD